VFEVVIHFGQTETKRVAEGAIVTIIAEDREGYLFDYWYAEKNAVEFADRLAATTTFTMPDFDVFIHAEYMPLRSVAAKPIELVIGSYDVSQFGEMLEKPPVPPMIIGGRTMLPFRYLVETVLGGTVDYEAAQRKITASVNGVEIAMYVGNETMTVNGVEQVLSQAPLIVEDRTLVPLRAFEAVVDELKWDGPTQMVTIYP